MAFTDGVRPGGLTNSREIKLIISYLLMSTDAALSKDLIRDVLVYNEIANMFEVMEALYELLQQGTIQEDEEGLLTITEKGKRSSEELVDLIPYTLREQALHAATQALTKQAIEKETAVDIQEIDGSFSITCSIDTTEHPMMSFTLRVPDKAQAESIRDRFVKDPTSFYQTLIAIATGDYQKNEDGIHIPL